MRYLLLPVLSVLSFTVPVLSARAQDGQVDLTFGTGTGIVIHSVGRPINYVYDVAAQSDGKLLVAGSTETAGLGDFAVSRYHPDGTLDLSFGTDGLVETDFSDDYDEAMAIVVLPDDGFVLGGYACSASCDTYDFALARYAADGALDPGFGTGGRVVTPFSNESMIQRLLLQPDGMIVAAGEHFNGTNNEVVLARYTTAGALDAGFGTGGLVTTDVADAHDNPSGIVQQPDGKLLVASQSSNGTNNDFNVVRYNANGSLDDDTDGDPAFGTGGRATVDFGIHDDAYAIALQSDGKILVGGTAWRVGFFGNTDLAVARLNTDGSLDDSFDGDGRVVLPVYDGGVVRQLFLLSGGEILLYGTATSATDTDIVLARLDTDGALDLAYGQTGIASINHLGSAIGDVAGATLQSGDRVVGAGSICMSTCASDRPIQLLRVDAGGTLDATFGPKGRAITDFEENDDEANGVAIQSDGKIVAVGSANVGGTGNFALARYLTDGSLDPDFGANGLLTTDVSGNSSSANAVALQDDGKIVSAGYASNGLNLDPAFARYLSDGTLDTGFGTGGLVVGDPGGVNESLAALAVLDDGKLLAAGEAGGDFLLVRLLADGTFDPGFGTAGIVQTDFAGGSDAARTLAVQPDGRIVVGGTAEVGGQDHFGLARYLADGSLDPDFGTGGLVTTAIQVNDDLYAIAVQADGKIVAAGETANADVSVDDFALVRYLSDGTLDPAFDTDGIVTTDIYGNYEAIFGLALLLDGKIVVAGEVCSVDANCTYDELVVARYLPDGTLDAAFGSGGFTTVAAGDYSYAKAVAVQPDGGIVAAGATKIAGQDFIVTRVTGSSGPLPVELLRFDALTDGTDVRLSWQTASETNNAGFEVQQARTDGAWQPVAFVEGRGTTAEAQTYTHRLTGLAPGTYRFRLRQVDFDGAFAYSPAVELTIELADRFVLSEVYPNPFNPQASFTLAVRAAQQVHVALYDLLGRRVAVLHRGLLPAGETHRFAIDGSGLASGVYLVRVAGAHFGAVRRVTLTK